MMPPMNNWIKEMLTTKMMFTATPYLLKLSGKIIIELPTIELAMATPVINTDFPIGIIIDDNVTLIWEYITQYDNFGL
jgi:hypothetical protein